MAGYHCSLVCGPLLKLSYCLGLITHNEELTETHQEVCRIIVELQWEALWLRLFIHRTEIWWGVNKEVKSSDTAKNQGSL